MTMRLTNYVPLVFGLGLAGCPGDDTTSGDSTHGSTSSADTTATSTPTTTSPTSAGTDAVTSSSGGPGSSSDGAGTSTGDAVTSSSGGPDSSSDGAGTSTGDADSSSGDATTGETSTTSGATGSGSSGDSDSGAATLDLGDPDCMADAECTTGVCWDFADYYPLCGGSVCSTNCVSDMQCQNVFAAAGAPSPQSATCGGDGRCNPMGTGFGLFFCA